MKLYQNIGVRSFFKKEMVLADISHRVFHFTRFQKGLVPNISRTWLAASRTSVRLNLLSCGTSSSPYASYFRKLKKGPWVDAGRNGFAGLRTILGACRAPATLCLSAKRTLSKTDWDSIIMPSQLAANDSPQWVILTKFWAVQLCDNFSLLKLCCDYFLYLPHARHH